MAAYPEPLTAPETVPGTVTAAEVSTPQGSAAVPEAANFGPDNRELPEEAQKKLKSLLDLARKDAATIRRNEIERIQRARAFWKGLQLGYFDSGDEQWHLPWEVRPGQQSLDEEELPRYAFVTNLYQAYGLSIMAVLSQDVPATKLWPQDPEQPEDVATVEAGKKIIELIERNNKIKLTQSDAAFLLWTDGKVGGFVRYVVDGQRFGFHPEEEYEPRLVKAGDDVYRCAQCGAETPVRESMGVCPQCGADLGEDNLVPAELVEVPRVKEVRQVPNGAEIMDMVGGLELKTPPRMNQQHEFGYLLWEMEVPRSRIKAAYPHTREKLKKGYDDLSHVDQDRARTARLAVSGGTYSRAYADYDEDLLTFTRGWIRPWWFESIEDDTPLPEYGGKTWREVLLELFPMGCYAEFAGDVYCCSRNESMDDSWRVMHALPGDGQDRPALGTSFISVQERINTLENLEVETAEHGIPWTSAAPWAFDFEGVPQTVAEPGAFYQAPDPPPGRALSDGFFSSQPAQLSAHIPQLTARLETETGQFLTGAFPALFGGYPGTDTVGGTIVQRDQALGRIGLVWRRSLYFWAELYMLGIDVFRKNRPDDVKIPLQGPGGEWKAEWIRKADLKGNLLAYPDTDSQYPTTLAQKRGVVDKLMSSPDPYLQRVLAHPENLSRLKRIIGLEDLIIPDDEARQKQHREIGQLLTDGLQGAGPVMAQEAVLDPVSQQPVAQPVIRPSVEVDQDFDNHQVEFETIQRWMFSEAGQKAKQENPAGYLNVRAHGLDHLKGIQQKAMEAAMQQQLSGGGNAEAPAQEPGG